MASRGRTRAHVVDYIVVGGKVMLYWSIFLALLEVIDWFGASQSAARAMDLVAMVATAVLFGLSTIGVRLALGRIARAAMGGPER